MDRFRESQTYSVDMVLENTGDGFGVLNILLGDQSQIGYLISVIGHKVLQRTLVVFSDLIRWKARHDEKKEEGSGQRRAQRKNETTGK